jgi:ribosomal protein S18 acetylase RimI-like enzyme
VLEFVPSDAASLRWSYALIRENMSPYHDRHGIPWSQAWIEQMFDEQDNYAIVRAGEPIGCISLEWLEGALYIHTLQLIAPLQGSIYGIKVLRWLLAQSQDRGCEKLRCRTFRDNPAVSLYQKLGFVVTGEENFLLDLELQTSGADLWPGRGERSAVG